MRALVYFAGGVVMLLLGFALIIIPPHLLMGLGIILVILSSVPFGLASSASMRSSRSADDRR